MSRERGRRVLIRYAILGVAVAIVVSGVGFAAWSRDVASTPASVVISPARASSPRATPSTPSSTVAVVARSRPMLISIPALGVSAPLVELGLQPNRQVQVPLTTTVAGWFKFGPTPGQMGSSVILGHVDSTTGPGVFFELRRLIAGNIVRVRLADGVVVSFVVVRVVQYAKSDFPDRLVYGSHGRPELQLVTCGGVFDHATGHYLANIVVYSRLLSST